MIATFPEFTKESRQAMTDRIRRQRIKEYSEYYKQSFTTTSSGFLDLELARQRLAKLKWKAINHLDKYLIEFESNMMRAGGKVIWAQDDNEAIQSISAILKKKNISQAVTKSSSTVGSLSSSKLWERENVKTVEADYGHYILQHETGSHAVVPALHKSAEEMAEKLYNTEEIIDKSPARLAHHIRRQLRYALLNSQASVAAAQFLIADAGAAVLCDDEGATLFTSGLSKTSFIVAGIDSMVASVRDLDLLLSMYSTFSTGQPLKTYNTIIKGPRQAADASGAEELYVVLVDNGRSDVLAHQHQRQVLSCINCGACLSSSAIYKTVGGKAYPGPAQSIAAPVKYSGTEYKYLADLATLDGSGSEICPVKINFPKLILHNRHYMVQQGMTSSSEKWFYFAFKKAMLKRDMMSWAGASARNKILESYFKSREGLRTMPVSAAKSFNLIWRERIGYK